MYTRWLLRANRSRDVVGQVLLAPVINRAPRRESSLASGLLPVDGSWTRGISSAA